ncbi:MAG: APC family permease [Planctomycetaceae bacterium]
MFGATAMGLGSIVGTGIFVSIGVAAGTAGPAVILAILLAAFVASCNGLSSAQLAAVHPVSGGTYEYGYRWLHPSLGFLAGWMFVSAKTASAATAALGFTGYALNLLGVKFPGWHTAVSLAIVVLVTVLVLSGIRLSNVVNMFLVSITVASLIVFVIAGVPALMERAADKLTPFFAPSSRGVSPCGGLLEACALMFVAYTGYGRIATLGEEISEPRRNIPLSIIITLFVAMALYASVGLVAVGTLGADALAAATSQQAAPLEAAAREFDSSAAAVIVAAGAMTSMLAVLLNLLLGLSRVVLAMGRRGDLPSLLGRLNRSGTTPTAAVVLVGAIVAGLVLLGDVKTTWSFSAFSVLMYYALTNLATLRMSNEERLYPPIIAWFGLLSCLFLAFWVEQHIWIVGLALVLAGLAWWWIADWLRRRNTQRRT